MYLKVKERENEESTLENIPLRKLFDRFTCGVNPGAWTRDINQKSFPLGLKAGVWNENSWLPSVQGRYDFRYATGNSVPWGTFSSDRVRNYYGFTKTRGLLHISIKISMVLITYLSFKFCCFQLGHFVLGITTRWIFPNWRIQSWIYISSWMHLKLI